MIEDLTGVIGRDNEIKDAIHHLHRHRNVCFVGAPGGGKTAVLKALFENWHTLHPKSSSLYVWSCKPTKWLFSEVAFKLYRRDVLPAEFNTLPVEAFQKRLNRMHYRDISRLISAATTAHPEIIFFLDNLDSATPASQSLIYTLLEQGVTICAATTSKRGLTRLLWQFQLIDLQPLKDAHIRRFVDSWIENRHILVDDRKLFLEHVTYKSAGNPLACEQLLRYFEHEPRIKTPDIRKLYHEAGRKELDLTPIIFIFFGVSLALRFISRSISHKELYILTSLFTASFVVIRFFAFRGMLKERS